MRILYHHRSMADGAEGIHIEEMVNAFRALGHQVRVVGVSAAASPDGRRTISRARRLVPAFMFEVGAIAMNLPEYLSVRSEIKSFAPDLMYKRHARFDLGALAAASRSGVPSVLEVNCVFSSPRYLEFEPHAFGRLARRFEAKALTIASHVLAVSTPLAREVEQIAARPASIMPNGADPDRFDPRLADPERVRVQQHLGDRFTIGWSGILREWHGLELLLEAVAPLPYTQLLIVGDGPARHDFEARAVSLGMGSRLRITGRVPTAEMPDYLAAMDVCVVADERTGVASPMKLLEYMAMARPVVAPALDNIRELMEDGVHGLLFRAGDSGALRQALSLLADDEALRVRLGQEARALVRTSRNWQQNAERVVAFARELQPH